jgi:hypothetical protein
MNANIKENLFDLMLAEQDAHHYRGFLEYPENKKAAWVSPGGFCVF